MRCRATVAPRMAPVRPIPPIVAQNSASGLAVRGQGVHLAVGHQQVQGPHVVAEAALGVVVLAVHVGGDRAADGHLPGAGQHRHPEPERQQRPHQRVQADPGLDRHRGRFGGGVDGEDVVQLGQVEGEPAGVLGGVAVAAAESARHHPAVVGGAQRGDGVGDRVDLSRGGTCVPEARPQPCSSTSGCGIIGCSSGSEGRMAGTSQRAGLARSR